MPTATPTTPSGPTPGLFTLPCFYCDYDYLGRVGDMQYLPDDSRRATVRYEGCECEHCAVVVTTPEAGPDTSGLMSLVRLLLSDNSTRTVLACPSHAEQMNLLTAASCTSCSTTLDMPDMDVLRSRRDGYWPSSNSRARSTEARNRATEVIETLDSITVNGEHMRVRAVENLGMGTSPTRRLPTAPIVSDGAAHTSDSGALWCSACADTAVSCEECSEWVVEDSLYGCDRCGVDTCYTCNTNNHRRCYQRDEVEVARGEFTPRGTIPSALALPALAGVTVRSTRAVGIEVETRAGRVSEVVEAEDGALVPVIGALGTDGSVNGPRGIEFRLLPQRGAMVEYAIRSMNAWCAAAGYTPDTSCGVHMHIDASDLSQPGVWRAYAMLLAVEDVLFGLAAAQRRNNRYCVAFGDRSRDILRNAVNYADAGNGFDIYLAAPDSRYQGVNCHSYPQHRTLEVRVFDTAHTPEAIVRYTLAAMLSTAAVDYAQTEDGALLLALLTDTPREQWATLVVSNLGRAGLIDPAHALLLAEQGRIGASDRPGAVVGAASAGVTVGGVR